MSCYRIGLQQSIKRSLLPSCSSAPFSSRAHRQQSPFFNSSSIHRTQVRPPVVSSSSRCCRRKWVLFVFCFFEATMVLCRVHKTLTACVYFYSSKALLWFSASSFHESPWCVNIVIDWPTWWWLCCSSRSAYLPQRLHSSLAFLSVHGGKVVVAHQMMKMKARQ